MARPQGTRLNRLAFDDVLRLSNLTPSDVADLSEIPAATIRGLMGGHHNASPKMAYRMAVALGVNAETLFPGLIPANEDLAAS